MVGQRLAGLGDVPISLFQDIGEDRIAEDKPSLFHRWRARSRSADRRPFLRISAKGEFNLRTLGGSHQFLLQIAQAALFVLTNQFADIFAGCAPVAGSYLSFDVALKRLSPPLRLRSEQALFSQSARKKGWDTQP